MKTILYAEDDCFKRDSTIGLINHFFPDVLVIAVNGLEEAFE